MNQAQSRARRRLTVPPVPEGGTIRQPIPNTIAGINFEVHRMKKYVDYYSGDGDVVRIARRVVDKCRDKDALCETRKIYKALIKNIRFVRDPTRKEAIQSPRAMLAEIKECGVTSGDCDEMSTLLATMLSAIGHEPRFRFGARGLGWQHVWVQDRIAGRLVDLDLAEKLPFGQFLHFTRFGIAEIWE